MTTPIKVGWDPIQIEPIFSYGQDWIATFVPTENAETPVFPAGTTVTARMYTDAKLETIAAGAPLKTWPCAIVDDTVRVHVEAADGPNTAARGNYIRISVVYPGTPLVDPYIWVTGKVSRRD